MNDPKADLEEVAELAAAMCDGQLTADEAARLEQIASRSDAARRYFLQYVQLHGELYWEHAGGREPPQPRQPVPMRRHRSVYAVMAVSLAIALVLAAIPLYRVWTRGRAGESPCVAQIDAVAGAQWSDDAAPNEDGGVPAGRTLRLRQGVAEVAMAGGARVILLGPAVYEPQSPASGLLSAGELTAHVPTPAVGFTIRTPRATIVDRGTEFGVAVQEDGTSEVEVFTGTVAVWLGTGPVEKGPEHKLCGGEALRVSLPGDGGPPRAARIAGGTRHFARSLGGSAARLETLVTADPHLIHHYTFEGATAQEKCRDLRDNLPLGEVAMCDGRAGGAVDYGWAKPDHIAQRVRPFRAARLGNSRGMALESQGTFHPPRAMTIELLLRFDGGASTKEGAIFAAVATRASHSRCGFFVAAIDDGRLAQLLDGKSAWLESGCQLVPGRWYYLASTFQVQGDHTLVNTYVANLSQGGPVLQQVIADQPVPGVPPASRLGIGAGLNGDGARAYPWAGALAEVAIYDAALGHDALEAHLQAVAAQPPADGGNVAGQ